MRLSTVLKYLSVATFFLAIISLIWFKLFFQKGVELHNTNRGVVAQLQIPVENKLEKDWPSNNISTPTQTLAKTAATILDTKSATSQLVLAGQGRRS